MRRIPQLPGLEETTVIEGKHETVLASAQVLRGKLNRTNQGLARDAFDLIVASKTEPRALQHAINAISRIETEVVLANLKLTSDDMAGMAAGVLHGIPPEFETDLSLLGYNAAAAAAENRYTRVTITLEPDTLVIKRRTQTGDEKPERYDTSETRKSLMKSGIGAYLAANYGIPPRTAERGIDTLVQEGEHGLVFDSTRADPGKRIRKATAPNADRKPERGADADVTAQQKTDTDAPDENAKQPATDAAPDSDPRNATRKAK